MSNWFCVKLEEYCDSDGKVVIAHVPALGTTLPSSVAHFRGKAMFELAMPDGSKRLHEAFFPLPVRLDNPDDEQKRKEAIEVCFDLWEAEYAVYHKKLQTRLTSEGSTAGATRELLTTKAAPAKKPEKSSLVVPGQGSFTPAMGDRPVEHVLRERNKN